MANTSCNNDPIRIAFSCLLLNAGETTRAVEIAKALRLHCREQQVAVDIQFFCSLFSRDKKIPYDRFVIDAGFPINYVGKGLKKEEWKVIEGREHAGKEFYVPKEKDHVTDMILDMKEELQKYDPEVIVHGFLHNLDAPVAAKILGIPSILFLPLPNDIDFAKRRVVTDFPDDLKTFPVTLLPRSLRKKLIHFVGWHPDIPGFISQPTIRAAALDAGWEKINQGLMPDLISSDLVLVNDLPGNFADENIPRHVFTGPVFSKGSGNSLCDVDPEITRIFDTDNKNKVFVAMGSSGKKEDLISAIQAVNSEEFHTVALVPTGTCTLEDMREALGTISPTLYLTDKFVPSAIVNGLADVAIIHGGQGTVQTALGSGTPVVGVAMQMEQEFNLAAMEQRGAGIKIPHSKWSDKNISVALKAVLGNEKYKNAAMTLQREINESNGGKVSAENILSFALERRPEVA